MVLTSVVAYRALTTPPAVGVAISTCVIFLLSSVRPLREMPWRKAPAQNLSQKRSELETFRMATTQGGMVYGFCGILLLEPPLDSTPRPISRHAPWMTVF